MVFWVLAAGLINALDTHEQVLMWICFKSSEYVPRNRTAGSYGNLLIILKNYEAFSKFTDNFFSSSCFYISLLLPFPFPVLFVVDLVFLYRVPVFQALFYLLWLLFFSHSILFYRALIWLLVPELVGLQDLLSSWLHSPVTWIMCLCIAAELLSNIILWHQPIVLKVMIW